MDMIRLKENIERRFKVSIRRQAGFPWVRATRRFMSMQMDIHNRCNLRCTMCFFADKDFQKIPALRMSGVAIEALDKQVFPLLNELWVSCGYEPLLAPDVLADVLHRAKAAGIPRVRFVTNATLLNEKAARMLVESGMEQVLVSLDGATAATYNSIRQGADFDKVIANVKRFQTIKREMGSEKPTLAIYNVLMTTNLHETGALVHLAADLGASWVVLQSQVPYAELMPHPLLKDFPDETNAALAAAHAAAKERGILLEAPKPFGPERPAGCRTDNGPPHCDFPWKHMVVQPDGDVSPCFPMNGKMKFGNLNHQTFDEIFYGEGFRELREAFRRHDPHPICRTCSLWHHGDLNQAATHAPRKIFPNGPPVAATNGKKANPAQNPAVAGVPSA